MTKIIEFKTKERTLAEIEEAASKEVAAMMRVALENKELVALFNDVYIAFNMLSAKITYLITTKQTKLSSQKQTQQYFLVC